MIDQLDLVIHQRIHELGGGEPFASEGEPDALRAYIERLQEVPR